MRKLAGSVVLWVTTLSSLPFRSSVCLWGLAPQPLGTSVAVPPRTASKTAESLFWTLSSEGFDPSSLRPVPGDLWLDVGTEGRWLPTLVSTACSTVGTAPLAASCLNPSLSFVSLLVTVPLGCSRLPCAGPPSLYPSFRLFQLHHNAFPAHEAGPRCPWVSFGFSLYLCSYYCLFIFQMNFNTIFFNCQKVILIL